MSTSANVKVCPKCGKTKGTSQFYKELSNKDSMSVYCISCINIKNSNYDKTKNGLSSKMYRGQKVSSKKRGHKAPNYSLEDFRNWLFNQPNFKQLFENWVKSGYSKKQIPSPDRLDDSKPYSLNNLQLVCFDINNKKQTLKFVENSKKKVSVFDIKNKHIGDYSSLRDCARSLNLDVSCVSRCCNGIYNSHKGYIFSFK